jgi:hypothetical protein
VTSASVLLDVREAPNIFWHPTTGCSLQGVGADPVSGRKLCFTAKLPFCLCL